MCEKLLRNIARQKRRCALWKWPMPFITGNGILKFFTAFLLILLPGYATILSAQTRIITVGTVTSLTISWSHDWKDVEEGLEHVVRFDVYWSVNDGEFQFIGQTPDDRVNYRPQTTWVVNNLPKNSKIVFGVRAVDWGGNFSDMATSVDPSSEYGGWYVLTDSIAPKKPGGISSQ